MGWLLIFVGLWLAAASANLHDKQIRAMTAESYLHGYWDSVRTQLTKQTPYNRYQSWKEKN